MKKIFLLAALVFTLIGCETEDVIYKGGDFIQFSSALEEQILVSEDADKVSIELILSKVASEDIEVKFQYEDISAVAGVNYTPVTSLIIPAGQRTVNLEIPIIDDADPNADRSFVITISSISNESYRVGIANLPSKVKTIVIKNDDCTTYTDYAFWTGNLYIEDSYEGPTTGTAGSSTCDVLLINGDVTGAGIGAYPTLLYFTPTDVNDPTIGTVEIKKSNYPAPYASYEYTGKGTYDYNTGEIIIDYKVTRSGALEWDGTTTITLL